MSTLFLETVNMSIAASWLVLAVLVLRFLLRKAPKWVRVLLWGIVAVRLCCPFSIESALSLIPSTQTVSPDIMLDWTPEISTGISSLDRVVNPVITEVFAPNPWASANPLQILIPVAANFWLLGILAMVAYAAVSYWRLCRKVATAVRLEENVFQSEFAQSPFVLGVFRPRIYLSYTLDETSRKAVIAHEMAHITRKDHWWKPLGFLLLTVHWFNPLMWLAYMLLCRDIELACDEKVIGQLDSGEKADYAQALVTCGIRHVRAAACPLAFGEVGVKARVKSVLHYKKPGVFLMILALILCVALAACFLTDPISMQETPGASFLAEILEIWDKCYLVSPLEGSRELSSADKITVPMQNTQSSQEIRIGDIIEIHYDGSLRESYPAQIGTVYQIRVYQMKSTSYTYFLTIAEENIYSIRYSTPVSSGGTMNADGSAYRPGERVWLEGLDGLSNLRGVTVETLGKDGNIIWSISIADTEENRYVDTVSDGLWIIRQGQ